ncbi:hypothetical protein SLS63_013881 [Diaporthe eres]|uniref:Aminoglycoside phosphotransferase domain-containing protein n=1 Tax=Diaporthe eres TaxID=83184 RepID=A0ABR1NM67_DIAER
MKINPTSQCLSLIIRSMEQIILPELISKAAISTGAQIKVQLEGLLKREGEGIPLLRDLIGEGNELAKRAAQLLEDPSIARRSSQITVSSRQVGGFDALAGEHARLTALLDDACRGLYDLTQTSTQAAKIQQEMAIWEYSYYNNMSSIRPKLFEDSGLPSLQDRMLHRSGDPNLSAKFLEEFLTQRHGPTKVKSLDFVPGGFGKQTYFSTVTWQDGQTEELITMKMDTKEAISESLLLHCAELLAQLHKTPLELFRDHVERFIGPGAADDTVEQRLHRLLGSWNEYRTDVEHLPSPFQTFAFDWLRRNVPHDTRRPVLVHGDFGIHNMLAVDDRITAVLDWECSDFGAPEQDLEWIRPHVSEHMSWHKFLEHYHACGGPEVTEDVSAFYGMWGMARPLEISRRARTRIFAMLFRTEGPKAVVENLAGNSAQAKL